MAETPAAAEPAKPARRTRKAPAAPVTEAPPADATMHVIYGYLLTVLTILSLPRTKPWLIGGFYLLTLVVGYGAAALATGTGAEVQRPLATVVIGGIFSSTEQEDVNKVPLLGDIPFAGNLFKNRTIKTEKTELLVFLTPRTLSDVITSAR